MSLCSKSCQLVGNPALDICKNTQSGAAKRVPGLRDHLEGLSIEPRAQRLAFGIVPSTNPSPDAATHLASSNVHIFLKVAYNLRQQAAATFASLGFDSNRSGMTDWHLNLHHKAD